MPLIGEDGLAWIAGIEDTFPPLSGSGSWVSLVEFLYLNVGSLRAGYVQSSRCHKRTPCLRPGGPEYESQPCHLLGLGVRQTT